MKNFSSKIHRRFVLKLILEGSKQPVPENKYAAVVLVYILIVARVVNAVV